MLEKLDQIPWDQLTHAYGPAGDVPDLIRQLTNSDKEKREATIWQLYGNIFHQGTRYEASPYAIPFIYELIGNEQVEGREELVIYLINLALGYEEYFLMQPHYLYQINEASQIKGDALSLQTLEVDEYGYSSDVEILCYRAVEAQLDVLVNLFEHENKRLSRAAIYVAAFFPQQAKKTLPAMKQVLPELDDEEDIANAVLSIGFLCQCSDCEWDADEFETYLHSNSKLIRFCTAIAFMINQLPTSEVINLLLEGILEGEAMQQVANCHFNDGNLSGYASNVLANASETANESVIEALCKALQTANAYQSLDITVALIEMLYKNRKQAIQEIPYSELKAWEVKILRAIAVDGGWKIDHAHFTNYSSLIRESGIANSQEALKSYLQLS